MLALQYLMVSQIIVIIGSGNGLVPKWHQAIPWTNDDLLVIALDIS